MLQHGGISGQTSVLEDAPWLLGLQLRAASHLILLFLVSGMLFYLQSEDRSFVCLLVAAEFLPFCTIHQDSVLNGLLFT